MFNVNMYSHAGGMNAEAHRQQVMLNMSGMGNPMQELASEDIELDDLDIDPVSANKPVIPILTKKGKVILALIILGSAGYYLYNKHKSNKPQNEGQAQPTQNNEAQPSQPQESATETANNTAQQMTQENGVVGE